MAKAKKKRASKYEDKLSIEGTFEDVIRVSVQQEPKTVIQPGTNKKTQQKGKK